MTSIVKELKYTFVSSYTRKAGHQRAHLSLPDHSRPSPGEQLLQIALRDRLHDVADPEGAQALDVGGILLGIDGGGRLARLVLRVRAVQGQLVDVPAEQRVQSRLQDTGTVSGPVLERGA